MVVASQTGERRQGLREETTGPVRLAELRTFIFSCRIVSEVGKTRQHFTRCLGNGRGVGREALSPVPCRNSLLGVMQMWPSGVNPLCAISRHCSLTAVWTVHQICESQRLVLSQVMMIRGGYVAELLRGSLNLGSVMILLNIYQVVTSWIFNFQMLTKLLLCARHCSQSFES